jgi:hypothetical protein
MPSTEADRPNLHYPGTWTQSPCHADVSAKEISLGSSRYRRFGIVNEIKSFFLDKDEAELLRRRAQSEEDHNDEVCVIGYVDSE